MSLPILIAESKGISPYTAKGALQNLREEMIIDFGGGGEGCDHSSPY